MTVYTGAALRPLHALPLLWTVHAVQLHLPCVHKVRRRHDRLLPGAILCATQHPDSHAAHTVTDRLFLALP